jgi:hypothetical protein
MTLRLLLALLLCCGLSQFTALRAQDFKPVEMDAAVVAQIIAKDSSYAAFYKSIPEKPEMVMCYDPKGVDIYNEQLLANKREAEKQVSAPEPTEAVLGVPDMEPAPSIEPAPEVAPTPASVTAPVPTQEATKKDKRKHKTPRN